MESLLRSLSQFNAELLLVALVLLAVALYLSVRNTLALKRQKAKWDKLLDGASGSNLENLLMDTLRENQSLNDRLDASERKLSEIETHAEKTKRHIGLVRYDAFEEVGGSQSFALAVYDDKGDGVVLNSIIGRTDCRVYAKPLVGGRSDRSLSEEERKAIEEALNRSKSAVS